jgi:hypothetical protein
MLSLQAFIDDSYESDFVLGGHIASAESWAIFAKEWETLLPSGVLAANGKYHFKMAEMASTPERMERVPAFYWLIEKHVLVSISCRFNLVEYISAKERVREEFHKMGITIDFDRWENPYSFAFRALVDKFHNSRKDLEAVIPLGEKVDFIFDSQSEKSFILAAWDSYIAGREDDVRDCYGATPRFENDQQFLPLQAADLWAWWVREWYEEEDGKLPKKMEAFDFGKWRGKLRPSIAVYFDENHIVEALEALAFENLAEALAARDPLGKA